MRGHNPLVPKGNLICCIFTTFDIYVLNKKDLKEDLSMEKMPAKDNQLKSVQESERIRTTSVSEEIAVAFEESKGDGLR